MNSNFRTILLTVGAPILALIATMFLFTGKGNLIAAGYIFYVPIFFLLCLFRPKLGLPLCILLATMGDLVKRLMLFDTRIQEQDIALVLLLVPAGIAGLVLYALFDLFRNWANTPKGIKVVVFGSIVLAIISVIGSLAGGAGLRTFGGVVNSSLYFILLGCLPVLFRTREDIIKTIRYLMFVFFPVALYGIKQGIWDFADFEYEYLRSGLTVEYRQLEETVRRVMSTLGTAVALSTICGCFAGLFFSTVSLNKKMRLTFSGVIVKVIFGAVFFLATYYTMTRIGYVCFGVSFFTVIVLRSKALTMFSIAAVTAAVVYIYAMADTWWQDDSLRDLQEQIIAGSEVDNVEMEQTAKLVTWNARLESMSHFTRKPEIWTPFGMEFAGKEDIKDELWIHDPLTEILVSRGYIGLGIIFTVAIVCGMMLLRFLWSIPKGGDEKLMRFLLAGGFGTAATGVSHGVSLFLFPINLVWALFFGATLALGLMIKRDRKLMMQERRIQREEEILANQ